MRRPAFPDHAQFLEIDVHADDLVTKIRQARRRDTADVPQAQTPQFS